MQKPVKSRPEKIAVAGSGPADWLRHPILSVWDIESRSSRKKKRRGDFCVMESGHTVFREP